MKRGRVRTAMFTSSQAAEEMSQRIPGLRAIWVPEAIELSDYKLGGALSERSIGLLEIGRSFERFNQVIREPLAKSGVKHLYSLEGHVFPTRKELAEGLAEGLADARGRVVLSAFNYRTQDTRGRSRRSPYGTSKRWRPGRLS